MPVLICILSHNNLALTKAAISSALAQQYSGPSYPDQPGKSTGLVVIDNASTDSTPQWLNANCTNPAPGKSFTTIMFNQRQSVAHCWNYILEWAFSPCNSNRHEGVLMLNNDVQIRPDTVEWLMRDGAPFVTAVSVRTEKELGYPSSSPSTRRPHPDFSCFLMKPACWKKVGRFDEGFETAFCEDNDYHVRMHLAGVTAMCIDLPFVHHGSQTVKQADKAEQRMIQRAADRNRERFEDMYGCVPGSEAYNAIFA